MLRCSKWSLLSRIPTELVYTTLHFVATILLFPICSAISIAVHFSDATPAVAEPTKLAANTVPNMAK
jgi:hypothetical protein